MDGFAGRFGDEGAREVTATEALPALRRHILAQ
jgi:hypothetical protein